MTQRDVDMEPLDPELWDGPPRLTNEDLWVQAGVERPRDDEEGDE